MMGAGWGKQLLPPGTIACMGPCALPAHSALLVSLLSTSKPKGRGILHLLFCGVAIASLLSSFVACLVYSGYALCIFCMPSCSLLGCNGCMLYRATTSAARLRSWRTHCRSSRSW